MIKIRLTIDIDINNFDEYTCPHICTLLRYHYCSMPHQVNNHELKLKQVQFDTLKGLIRVFLKELILLSDKLFETGITKKLENILLFLLLRS